jgi:hypothetical protein
MTMLMLSLVQTLTVLVPLAGRLASWLLARSLNMPEPLVHAIGLFVLGQVQAFENNAFENSIARSFCPVRLARRFKSWFR